MIKKIISGGQTGADIAGVDAAISCGVSYGGWLPKGRMTEKGTLSGRYTKFQVMTRGGYPKRTEQNIVDSDGTVVFSFRKLSGGSALTRRLCQRHGRPFLYIDLSQELFPAETLKEWLSRQDIQVLNVAGSRASKHPGIYSRVFGIIQNVLCDQSMDNGICEDVLPWAV
ncbi:putative molybdenum carrier protein [Desulfobacter curvatus]|uniref:putative molybdenum carrier protein n=1 Tax=Desulfobacter curvatus TaxID=2290 RepID=UPI00037822A4|nr:putative molybdenum carrier protein [Desulfobacter curvatus]